MQTVKSYLTFIPIDFASYLRSNADKITSISWFNNFQTFNNADEVKSFLKEQFNDLDWLKYHTYDDCIRCIIHKENNKISIIVRDYDIDNNSNINDIDSIEDGIIAPW